MLWSSLDSTGLGLSVLPGLVGLFPLPNYGSFLLLFFLYYYFLKIYFIDYAITVVPVFISPKGSFFPSALPHLSSCPWVIHISSLASTFPILFLPSPCLFSTYHLCYLFSVPSPLSPPPTPLLITHHVISISVILFLF